MKKSLKKFICFIFNIFFTTSVFAAGGVMSGEKNIKMVQTNYFDIIYSESLSDSAALLYENADKIYENLDEMYDWHRTLCRMPVVLTSKPEIFNAWYWGYTYNHIVLLVTAPIDEIDNQPDTLLWTFRHELTHAFTYNMKSKVVKFLDTFLSDGFSFGILTVTPGMAEGATVSSESYEGNGRLNDEFSKQIVKQAKIEGKFPAFGDTQGSSTEVSKNQYYYFNGAFHEYLQKTYGLESYRDFWYRCINKSLTMNGAFKKIYGISLKQAWNDFEKSYKVPDIPENPVESGYAEDFFDSSLNTYSRLNKTGATPESLSVSEKGLVYLDSATNAVYFVQKEDLKNTIIQPVRLFDVLGIDSVSQSPDGKYIVVTYYDRNSAVYLSRVRIFDTENKNWYTPEIHGIKNAGIFMENDDYFLYGLHFENGKNRIGLNKIEFASNGNINGLGEEVSCQLPEGKSVSSIIQAGNGKIAFISNERLIFSIKTMNSKAEILETYYVPDDEFQNFNMHYLSANPENPDQLYFSWVTKGSMPRTGTLNLDDGQFTFSQDDISGGMYYPVVCENKLFYVGKFYEYNRLFRKNVDARISTSSKICPALTDVNSNNSEISTKAFDFAGKGLKVTDINSLEESTRIHKYNPFVYMTRGILLPSARMNSSSFDSKHRSQYSYDSGFTYTTKNPWDDILFTLSFGYCTQTQTYGFYGQYGSKNMGTGSTNAFQWLISDLVEWDNNGLKTDEIQFSSSSRLYSGLNSRFSISPKIFLHAGRSNETPLTKGEDLSQDYMYKIFGILPGNYESVDNTVYFYNQNSIAFYYDNYTQQEDNSYGRKGFLAGFVPVYQFSYDVTNRTEDYVFGDVTLFAQAYIPRLLPFKTQYGIVNNLPVKLFASAFTTSSVRSTFITIPDNPAKMNPDLALASAEMLLFSRNLQKSFGPSGIFYIYDINLIFSAVTGYAYSDFQTYGRSFGVLHTAEMVKEIVNNKILPTTVLSLRLSAGVNPMNFGTFAGGQMTDYFYFGPVMSFTNIAEDRKLDFSFGIDISF